MRSGYRGGYTDVFSLKKFVGDDENDLYYLDVNSLYPFCMSKRNLICALNEKEIFETIFINK